jgi:amino acid adenylation domain-containing protein
MIFEEPLFNLHDHVRRAARLSPERVAVRLGSETLTYRELAATARRLAEHLVALGVKPGDRVGTYQPKSVLGVASLLGILEAGAAYVPVDPQAPPERARWILEHAGVSVLFAAGRPLREAEKAGRRLADLVIAPDLPSSTIAPRALDLGALVREAPSPSPELPRVADGELAYLLYTSGSTGTPKGVAITHGQSLAFVRPATQVFGIRADDVLASHAPFNFDLSVIDLYCAFAAGAEVVLLPETHLAFPAKLAALLESAQITVWNSVPSALIALAPHLEGRALPRLRLVMFAGEPYPWPHLRRLFAALPGATLLNVYGQTEANSSTYHEVRALPERDDAPLPIGRTFPNYDVLLLDEAQRPITEPDQPGELFVVGGAVAAGYWRDPERTARAFVQHPLRPERRQVVYRTGDRALLDASGELVFLGRADFAVKVRGFRVELGEVEAVALACPGVLAAACVAVPDDASTHRLVLFVAAGDGAIEEPRVRAALAEKLPRYMLPELLIPRATLPRTGTGKVDRNSLRPEAEALLAASASAAG